MKDSNTTGNMTGINIDKENYLINQIIYCRSCNEENTCVRVAIPYVLRYLCNELAAMNIKLTFAIK